MASSRPKYSIPFILLFILFVLLVAKIIHPFTLHAQSSQPAPPAPTDNKIGTHLGEGDARAQADIINTVLTTANGVTDGFPVTVTLYTNSSNDDVKLLAETTRSHHLFTILRIDKACDVTDPGQVMGFIANNFQGPGTNYIITFGNEVNNQKIECPIFARYQTHFDSINTADKAEFLSPSALDQYNTDYPAAGYINNPIFRNAHIRTANAYGCVGKSTYKDCQSSLGFDTYNIGLKGIASTQKLYLTEFSLSPENKSADAPDADISNVIQFIQTYGPQTPAIKITPLIRNTCNNEGAWLIYVNGRVFTKNGNEVTKTCAKTNNAAYFEYNIHRTNTDDVMSHFTSDYSVSCLPKQSYTIVASNPQKCSFPFIGCNGWNSTAEYKIDANGKIFGLFRSQAAAEQRGAGDTVLAPTNRLESIEAYLSAKNLKPVLSGNPGVDKSTFQAPIYKLKSQTEQCSFVYDKLTQVKALCGDLMPEDTVNKKSCALDKQITGTDFTHLQLLQKMSSRDKCGDIMAPTGDPKLQDAILKVNPALELAYRPAFIVVATKVDGTQGNPRFESQGEFSKDKFIQVDYLEVKVPDFGTDHSALPGNTEPYRDPLRLSADVFVSSDAQMQWDKSVQAERDTIKSNIKSTYEAGQGPVYSDSNLPMKCWKDDKLVDCRQDPLADSLLRYINANSAIMSPDHGSFRQNNPSWTLPCQANEADFYPDRYGNTSDKKNHETATKIGSQLSAVDVGTIKKKTSAQVKIQENSDALDQGSSGGYGTTQIFFVSPLNYNLQYAQNAFLSQIPLDQQKKFLTANFPQVMSLDLNNTHTGAPAQRDNGNQEKDPLLKTSVSVDVNAFPDQQHPLLMQVAASIANIPTRLFALLNTSEGSGLNVYTLKCTGDHATEDWLLGKCTQGPSTTTPVCSAGTKVTSCNNFEVTDACEQCDSKGTPACPARIEDIHPPSRGNPAYISDGVMGLALKVSQTTCTPAEVIIGVLAKESRGLKSQSGSVVYATGDAKEQIVNTAQSHCVSLNPNDSTSADYGYGCGAFQYSQLDIHNQIAKYGPAIKPCLDSLSITDTNPDTRQLGVSMCVASVNLWRGLDCYGTNGNCTSQAPTYGCTGKAASYGALSEPQIRFATSGFHGSFTDNADNYYYAFIQKYAKYVQAVRDKQALCAP